MDAMPEAGNRRSEVVVAMANVVVIVAEAKCRVEGRSVPDARALRRIEIRRGVPGWLEGGRPLTSPQAFFLSICSVVLVIKKRLLIQTSIYWRGTSQRLLRPVLKNRKHEKTK